QSATRLHHTLNYMWAIAPPHSPSHATAINWSSPEMYRSRTSSYGGHIPTVSSHATPRTLPSHSPMERRSGTRAVPARPHRMGSSPSRSAALHSAPSHSTPPMARSPYTSTEHPFSAAEPVGAHSIP